MQAAFRPSRVPVIAAIAAVAALLAGCGNKHDRIESGLRKGAEFVRAADWDKANVEVRNVLQIDPKNAQAYFIAGQIGEGQHDIQRAYASYQHAVDLKPELLEASVGLARTFLFANEVDRADATIKVVLAREPNHVGARTLDAAVLMRRGKAEQAMTEARALVEGPQAGSVDAAMLLAGLYANQGKRAEALGVVERALAAQPKNIGLLQVAAQISGSAPKDDPVSARAADFLRRATQEMPRSADLWRAWSAYHVQRGEIDAAEAVMRDAVRAMPADSQRQIELLNFLGAQRGLVVAEAEYRAAIKSRPRDMALRFGLAGLYRGFNRQVDAQRVLAEIADLGDDASAVLAAKNQLAAYRLAAGQAAQARQLVAEVLKASPRDNAALVLRGRMNLRDGNARDAVIDLRTVARDQPGSPEVIGLLARAHRSAGEPQLAREVLVEAVKARPENPELHVLLASDMSDAKEFRGASAELDAALKVAPGEPRLYEARAKLAQTQGDTGAAEKALLELKARFPRQALGYVRLGQFYTEHKRYDAALKEYDAAQAALPGEAMPYIASIGLLVGTKKFDEALARIEARQKSDPKSVLHYQLRGDVAIAKHDLAAAEQAYRGAIAAAPSISVGYVNAARVLGLRGDAAGAIAVLVAGEKAAPDEILIPLARAEWLTRARRTEEAIELYETLLKRAPEDDTIANNLAFLLAESKGDRKSVERALTLAARFVESGNPGYLDSLGWIHHKLGAYDQAVPLLERAVALSPQSPLLNLHLGTALMKSGHAERGKEFLRKAVDSRQDLPNLDEARAMLAQG